MITQEMEVMSTHCSATFGSRESVSVGVSGKEEPDSCIWHNPSSVMISNMVSSGGNLCLHLGLRQNANMHVCVCMYIYNM